METEAHCECTFIFATFILQSYIYEAVVLSCCLVKYYACPDVLIFNGDTVIVEHLEKKVSKMPYKLLET